MGEAKRRKALLSDEDVARLERWVGELSADCTEFHKPAQGALERRIVTFHDMLLSTVMEEATPKVIEPAFIGFIDRCRYRERGHRPLCLTCHTEFGPDDALPKYFLHCRPFAAPGALVLGLCRTCVLRHDVDEKIRHYLRHFFPELGPLGAGVS